MIEFPIRINKYLKEKGYSSRRQADRFIEEGRVFVNGKPAELGQQIQEDDVVKVDAKVQQAPKNYTYMLFNKPKGVVSVNAQRDEKEPQDIDSKLKGLSPVGRLDKDSHGLMLFTDDGRIVNKLLNPQFDHDKEYIVKVDKDLKPSFKRKMEGGVDIEGYTTKEAEVNIRSDRSFSITLREGKKHQIRRMATALGYVTKDLKRIRILNLELGNLPKGSARELTDKEREELLSLLEISGPTQETSLPSLKKKDNKKTS